MGLYKLKNCVFIVQKGEKINKVSIFVKILKTYSFERLDSMAYKAGISGDGELRERPL